MADQVRRPSSWPRAELLLVSACLLVTAWVHRRSLVAFFTPDDLVTLEMAAGLHASRFTIWRLLSENLYFRMMLGLVGLNPIPYHLVSLILHLANTWGVYWLARRLRLNTWSALFAGVVFGTFPLFVATLSQAVTINDVLACSLSLIGVRLLFLDGVLAAWGGAAAFVLALLSKESVIFLPWLFMWLRPQLPLRRYIVPVMLSCGFLALFFYLRSHGLAPAGQPYSVHLGVNLIHNLMTFLVWATDLVTPIPDLTRSYSTTAWRTGIWILAALLPFAIFRRCERRTIILGFAWSLLALLPVLGLERHTYSHYMYVPMVGFAIAVAGCLHCLAGLLQSAPPVARLRRYALPVIVCLAASSYATRADYLIGARLRTSVQGSAAMPMDPFARKMEEGRRALGSLGQFLTPATRRIVIVAPVQARAVFGARSGRRYHSLPAGQRAYDLMEAVLDSGRAVRLFYRSVDTVAFVASWSARYKDYAVFLPTWGYLRGFGTGPAAQASAIAALIQDGLPQAAMEHAENVLKVYPDDAYVRLAYAGALYRSGSRDQAFTELRRARENAADSALIAQIDQVLAEVGSTTSRSGSGRSPR